MTRILYALFIILTFSGCTTNNGDIGNWFGTWQLDSITIDGNPDTEYTGDQVWMFQSKVFCMRSIGTMHSVTSCWGTWSADGTMLTIDLSHSETDEDKIGDYTPFPSSHLSRGINHLTIERMTSHSLVLSATTSSASYTYRLTHRH